VYCFENMNERRDGALDALSGVIVTGFFVVMLAGTTQGLTGFGFSLVFVSCMLLFIEPKVVVPVVTVHSALINVVILAGVRKWVDVKRIMPLTIAGIAGMPAGVYMLDVLDVNLLRIIIGIVIVLFAAAFLSGFEIKVRNERGAFFWVGLLSGALNGSTGFSGPPVILFFTNQGLKKNTFRANLVAYFMVLNFATLAFFYYRGFITPDVIRYSVWLLPSMVAGALAGIALSTKVDERVFRTIALVIVIIAGLIAAGRGIISFL